MIRLCAHPCNQLFRGRGRYSLETIGQPIRDSRIARGQQMEYPVTPDEFRPVTIDDVISRVPVNPSCMSLSCRVQAVTHTHLEPSPKEARPYLSAFYPMKGAA